MARTATSFSRQGARYQPQARVLIICEDTKSGKIYLEDAAKHFRAFALVEFSHCGHTDPKGIVLNAVGRKGKFDEIYCVLDRDSHHGWDEAFVLAESTDNVKIIASYPSFEYWLLLHFIFTRAPQMPAGALSSSDRVVRELKKMDGMADYEKGYKGKLFLDLLPRLETAIRHGERAMREGIDTNEPNPSTQIHDLLQRFDVLSKPIRI